MRHEAVIGVVFLSGWLGGQASAQTAVDLRTQSKNVDFSGASATKPSKTGAALPGGCSVGETFFLTSAAAGQNLYFCTAGDVWSLQGQSPAPVTSVMGRTGAVAGQAGDYAFDQIAGSVGNAQIGVGIDAAKIGAGAVSNAVFGYLANVRADLQSQLDSKAAGGHSHPGGGDLSGEVGGEYGGGVAEPAGGGDGSERSAGAGVERGHGGVGAGHDYGRRRRRGSGATGGPGGGAEQRHGAEHRQPVFAGDAMLGAFREPGLPDHVGGAGDHHFGIGNGLRLHDAGGQPDGGPYRGRAHVFGVHGASRHQRISAQRAAAV